MNRYRAMQLVVVVGLLVGATGLMTDVYRALSKPTVQVPGGDASRAQPLLRAYGCAACHTIPGVIGANQSVGPSLDGYAQRAYIAGKLPNEPENLVYWLRAPQSVVPGNAMPNLGVTEQDARDIAAYLYTLK